MLCESFSQLHIDIRCMSETTALTFQVPDPLPASPDPTDPSTEQVSEFPSRQTPRQGISFKVYHLKNKYYKLLTKPPCLNQPQQFQENQSQLLLRSSLEYSIIQQQSEFNFNFFFSQESVIPDEMAKLLQQNPNIAQVKFV